MTELPNPNRQPILRKYMFDVIARHGYVRFIGMPSLQNNPDVAMGDLYIPQSISLRHLRPEEAPPPEELRSPVKELLANRRIVVLGDPGCGKSTLINFFAWYLSSGFIKEFPGELARILPVPIVLRDLDLTGVEHFDDLIQAFMKLQVARKLKDTPELLEQYMQAGRVLFLIDGLDEVASSHRVKLRDIILQGFARYPKCFFLCTSRIVGYDLAPLTYKPNIQKSQQREADLSDANQMAEPAGEYAVGKQQFEPVTYYCAPLTNTQIGIFAKNWALSAAYSSKGTRCDGVRYK